MRKLAIISTIAALLSISSALYVYFDKEPLQEQASKQPQPEADLLGQTFSLTYYPMTASDWNFDLAKRLNKYNYVVSFETDSTYLQRSNNYLSEYGYMVTGDSIYLNNRPYSMNKTVDGLLFRDSLFEIELTPLR